MDGLNLDPGLRQAYTKQTEQRFLTEAKQARLLKSVQVQKPGPKKEKQLTFGRKLRAISHIIRETGSDIISVIRASNGIAKA